MENALILIVGIFIGLAWPHVWRETKSLWWTFRTVSRIRKGIETFETGDDEYFVESK